MRPSQEPPNSQNLSEGAWSYVRKARLKFTKTHVFIDETKEETLCGLNRLDRPMIAPREKCKTCEYYLNEFSGQAT